MYSNFNSRAGFDSDSSNKSGYGAPGRPMGNPAIFGNPSQTSTPSYGVPGRPMGNPAIFGPQATANQPAASSFANPISSNSSGLRKISLSELAEHNTMGSLWIGYKGFVYDATDYKHSGGLQAILRGGGKDATQIINRQHSWVKVDEVLKSKRIGILEDD